MRLLKLENLVIAIYFLVLVATFVWLDQLRVPEKQGMPIMLGVSSMAFYLLSFRVWNRMAPSSSRIFLAIHAVVIVLLFVLHLAVIGLILPVPMLLAAIYFAQRERGKGLAEWLAKNKFAHVPQVSATLLAKLGSSKFMKTTVFTALHLFITCLLALSASAESDFKIAASLTAGERSKDSSSQTTTISVNAKGIVWEETSSGGGRNREPAVERKELKLTDADRDALLKVIRDNGLLVSDSITLPQLTPTFYFEINISIGLDGKKGLIGISGPRSASEITEQKLYKRSLLLLKELHRIIHAQDPSVDFEEPVRAKVKD